MTIPAIQSRIEGVTVYASGATVTRSATVEPVEGCWPRQIRVAGLPLCMDDTSVQVRLESSPGGAPAAVGVRVVLEVPDVPAPEPPDEAAIREAHREALFLQALIRDSERQSARLSALALPSRPCGKEGEPPPASPHDARLGLLEFQQERLMAIAEKKRGLERQLREAEERKADLIERGRRASTAREPRENELRKSVVVALCPHAGKPGGKARVVIEYQVPGARWAPSYVLRFGKDFSSVDLAMRAVVAQRTGEDWKDVRLTLSTANLQAWTELPEMKGIRIGRAQPPLRSGWRPPPVGAEALFSDYDRDVLPVTGQQALPGHSSPLAGKDETKAESGKRGAKGRRDPGRDRQSSSEGLVPPPAPAHVPRGAPVPSGGAADEDRTKMAESVMLEAVEKFIAATGEQHLERLEQSEDGGPPLPPPSMDEVSVRRGASPGRARISGEMADRMVKSVPRLDVQDAVQAKHSAEPAPCEEQAEYSPDPAGWLDYGVLRMPGPAEKGRGRLVRPGGISLAMEMFADLQVQIRFDIAAVVSHARNSTLSLGPLPPDHRHPTVYGGFYYAFSSEPPANIPSDGLFHAIAVTSRAAEAKMWYVTVPREGPEAFRFAEVINPFDAPLLSGPADVYVGSEFLMTIPVRETAPKGYLRLGLGVEQAVKVARNSSFEEETTGLMGGTLNLKHKIRVEVANLLPAPIRVEVRERVPVTSPGEENVTVAISEATPPWEKFDPEGDRLKGGHRWLVSVNPGEKVPLQAAYTVTIPSKMELVGGNRRER